MVYERCDAIPSSVRIVCELRVRRTATSSGQIFEELVWEKEGEGGLESTQRPWPDLSVPLGPCAHKSSFLACLVLSLPPFAGRHTPRSVNTHRFVTAQDNLHATPPLVLRCRLPRLIAAYELPPHGALGVVLRCRTR